MSSALRPKGTVEVSCSAAGCGVAWWVDPLDPKLLSGHRWDCGADHGEARRLDRLNAELHLRYGVQYCRSGGAVEGCSEGVCGGPCAWHVYRYVRWPDRRGLLLDKGARRSISVAGVFSLIEWDVTRWPAETLEIEREPVAPGMVHWNGYRDCDLSGHPVGKARRYTFANCARCGHEVHVDVDDPSRASGAHIVGGYGGGVMRTPGWLATTSFRCETAFSRSVYAPQPCALAHGPVMQNYEASSGARWTWWTSGSSAKVPAYVIFRAKGGADLALMRATSDRFDCAVTWGSPADLLRLLPPESSDEGDPWELRGALTLLAGGTP